MSTCPCGCSADASTFAGSRRSCASCTPGASCSGTITDPPFAGDKLCFLAQRVFDAVKVTFNASPCTVTLINPPQPAVALISATVNETFAAVSDTVLSMYDDAYRQLTAVITADGTASCQGANGSVFACPCTFAFNFSGPVRWPGDAVFPAYPVCRCGATVVESAPVSVNTFDCLCDGAALLCVCSAAPYFVPLLGMLCPEDVTCRLREDTSGVPENLFPSEPASRPCDDRTL